MISENQTNAYKKSIVIGAIFHRTIYRVLPLLVLIEFCLILTSGALSAILVNALEASWAKFLDELFFFGFLFLLTVAVVSSGRFYLSRSYPWLFAFAIVGSFSSVINGVPIDIAFLGFLLAIKPLLLLIAYQSVPLDKRAAERILKDIDALFCVITVTAVAYALFFELMLGFNPLPGNTAGEVRLGLIASRSYFVHASPFSSIMTLMALYYFSRILLVSSKRSILLFFLSILGAVLTVRLKTLFLLPVGLILIYFLVKFRSWRVKTATLVKGGVLALLCLFFIVVLAVIFRDILSLRLASSTSSVRTILLRHAVTINEETYGLGAGFGMYGSAVSVSYHYSGLYSRFGIDNLRGATPENPSFITDQWWAWLLGEVGYLGTAIFIAALLLVTRQLYLIAEQWRIKHSSLAILGYTAIASLIYGILAGYAGVYLTAPPTGYYIMSLAGLTFALHRGMQRKV